jgi:asparagine synthase (glutamine-hydrolysing)
MCGIAGIFGVSAHSQLIMRMLEKQSHRGPDFTAIKQVAQNGFLGHNRLSIIDLSSAANQPFSSDCGRYTLVFNGEIYNYLELKQELRNDFNFKTNSDTEVLLAAFLKFGESCVEKLNGMFSFAIYDSVTEVLFASRDRFGVKPFYYYVTESQFIFGSEIGTLFEAGIPKMPNSSVWSSYLVNGSYGAPNETFWQNVNQLAAGHSLIFNKEKVVVKRWYNFVERVLNVELLSEKESSLYIEELLLNATKLRFRADVPVGFNLSGGVDSSTLLGLIHAQHFDESKIHAFTFVCNDSRYDELQWVKGMLSKTNFPLHVVPLDFKDVPELFETISAQQLEPFGGIPTIAYAQIFRLARELGIKVLLDGQGADEVWAGYDYYLNTSGSVIQGTNGNPFKPHVLEPAFSAIAVKTFDDKPFESNLKNLQYRDLFYTKLPRALRFSDRVSMLYGTELREPFLDFRLMEYIFAQPDSFKIKDGNQKWLLRKIATKYLSSEIASAPKRPLQTPQREWLSEELKTWVIEKTTVLKKHEFFIERNLENELDLFFKGQNQSSFHIWQYISAAQLLQ